MKTTLDSATKDTQSTNQIRKIKAWFETAVPDPSPHNTSTQLAVHFEEVAEMLEALAPAGSTFPAKEQLHFSHDVMNYVQRQMKTKHIDLDLTQVNRVNLLDALCDQVVTAIGVAHMFGMDIESALLEVGDSNNSKFDSNGNPIFDAQNKIIKGPNYRKPNLTPYVGD